MKGIACSLLLVWGVVLLFLPQQSHALSFTVGSASVTAGTTFSIDVTVTNAVDLTSWQLDVGYDPSRLQANSVTEGPFLSSFGTTLFVPGFIDNTSGLIGGISNFFVDLVPFPTGSGVLATIEFTALASGPTALATSNVFANGLDSGFTVNPVPEPSAFALLLIGGLMLWGMRRWGTHGAATK